VSHGLAWCMELGSEGKSLVLRVPPRTAGLEGVVTADLEVCGRSDSFQLAYSDLAAMRKARSGSGSAFFAMHSISVSHPILLVFAQRRQWLPPIGPCGVSASHLAPDQEGLPDQGLHMDVKR